MDGIQRVLAKYAPEAVVASNGEKIVIDHLRLFRARPIYK